MTIAPYADNLAHLQDALLALNLRLHRHLLRMRAVRAPDGTPDEMLGLYISDEDVDALLDGLYAASAPSEADQADRAPIETLSILLDDAEARHMARETASRTTTLLRLPDLCEHLGLTPFERQVVLLALAAELDRRYERLFGYLNDDVTRRWPTVELALSLFTGTLAERVRAREAFTAHGRLRRLRVVQLGAETSPLPPSLLSQALKLDDRIVSYLLGSATPDPALARLLQRVTIPAPRTLDLATEKAIAKIASFLASGGTTTVVLTGPDEGRVLAAGASLAQAAWTMPLLALDGTALGNSPTLEDTVGRAVCEAHLTGSALAVRNSPALEDGNGRLSHLLAMADVPTLLLSADAWSTPATLANCPVLHVPAPDTAERERLWAAELAGCAPDVQLEELADRFRFTSGEIATAAARARLAARIRGEAVQRADLFASCRTQSSLALDGLAQQVESIHTWDDLILPVATKAQLLNLEHWVKYRHVVYGTWGFAKRVMLGRGLAVLFMGPSGTGKTMAAGILARELELDLYRIDLSSVVSKYIGETEKNLSRIFTAAETAHAILFFDEADALFGKRSEVKDAHDRYANIEVSYLLQRMEAYDGIAILATNFRQNLDHAFARRMHVTVEFPFPQADDRQRIWRHLLPPSIPQTADVDVGYLARQFGLAGGNIKNCALTAAFAAAADGGAIQMRHLVQAVAREYEKLDQPVLPGDFSPHYHLVRSDAEMEREAL